MLLFQKKSRTLFFLYLDRSIDINGLDYLRLYLHLPFTALKFGQLKGGSRVYHVILFYYYKIRKKKPIRHEMVLL
jgi:hypothetical protein